MFEGTQSFSLAGKWAVVTGASRGLGAAMAVAFAKAGANLVLVARSDQSDTARRIRELGREVKTFQADLARREETKKLIADLGNLPVLPTILVNNAGMIRRAPALEFPEVDWDEVLELNLSSLFFLSQGLAAKWEAAKSGGKIINIASMLSYQGGIRVPSYTAAKTGVLGLTRLLANELAPIGVQVNAIAPGYMATENTAPLRADKTRNAEILGRIPTGRWGESDDLGGAAVFLASSASDYVTGISLPVDGGWLSR